MVEYECDSAIEIWTAAFYFTVASITSVGYGDIRAFPTSYAEQARPCICQIRSYAVADLGPTQSRPAHAYASSP